MSEEENDRISDGSPDNNSQLDGQSDGDDTFEPSKSKKSSSKSKKVVKKKRPETVEEICDDMDLENPDIKYSAEDMSDITSSRQFINRFKDQIQDANPNASAHKISTLSAGMFKEFQDLASMQFINKQQGKGKETVKGKSKKAVVAEPSDEEFDQFLEAHEKQQDDEEAEREKLRHKRNKKIADNRAVREANRIKLDKPEEIIHQDYCTKCENDGELLLCDFCPQTYHLSCLTPKLKEAPEGDWMCPACEDKLAKKEDIAKHRKSCEVCKEDKYLLYCNSCVYSYHAYCISPPLQTLPGDEEFVCPRCTIAKPEKEPWTVLSWKIVETKYPDPWKKSDLPPYDPLKPENEAKRNEIMHLRPSKAMGMRKERFYFMKFKFYSYWHCEWIPELLIEAHFPLVKQKTIRKYDLDQPPVHEIEEMDDPEDMEEGEDGETVTRKKKDDPLNLYERFYKYGVKKDWLVVGRVLNHSSPGKGQYDYFIKWSELSYEHSTWERDDLDIPGFDDEIFKYWLHRERMTGEHMPKAIRRKIDAKKAKEGSPEAAPKKKIIYDIKKKHEVQPDYLDETGGNLHPYQLEGINWLRHCFVNKTNSILADEMGLGKTVQAMTFLYSLYKEGACEGPFLVAAPLSTLLNWEREAHFWCPDFYCVTYAGHQEAKAVLRKHEFSFDENDIGNSSKASKMRSNKNIKFHVLLTSYEQINLDKAILSSVKWGALVVDEAHRLKNNESLFFKNLSEYSVKYRLLLTGTPLQNNLEELFHLLNFLCPETFNELEQFTQDELIVPINLCAYQKKYYKNVLTRNFEALHVKNSGASSSLLNILMELKKCCNHPYLFLKASLEAPRAQNGMYELNGLVRTSGKLIVLQKMLRKLFDQGNRVLIFSQMTRMLDILEDFCEGEGYIYERIDGSITGKLRQEAIDRFNKKGAKQFIFLLSTRAGGLGINLATADTVIIYDSDWNPHNDIQAFSRAHRLGQKNTVMIYRFVTKNSIEERITSVAKKKMLLTHLVVRASGSQKGPSMSKTELDDVLRWGTEELFKDDANEDNDAKNDLAIVWDDKAIDSILERKAFNPEEKIEDKKDWSDEYLNTFKVANYLTKEVEEEEEEEREVITNKGQEGNTDYWEKLLRHHFEHDKETELQNLGKGKRVRKQINYATNTVTKGWQQNNEADAEADADYSESFSEESDGSDEEGSQTGSINLDKSKKVRSISDQLPPLLSKVNGQLEVLGFNPRQRKAFYKAAMRWGMPPVDAYQSQWLVRDLKSKSDSAYKAYASLFMRHLCEPANEHVEAYNDGVPREGLSRSHLLGRIGIMALIRRKVQEFEALNGEWSMPEIKEQIDADNKAANLLNKDSQNQSREGSQIVEKTVDMNADATSVTDTTGVADMTGVADVTGVTDVTDVTDMTGVNDATSITNITSVTDVDMNGTSVDDQTSAKVESSIVKDEPELEVLASENVVAESVVSEVKEEAMGDDSIREPSQAKSIPRERSQVSSEHSKERPQFSFNICDGAFTELHYIWAKEEELAVPDKEYEVWYRRHDYWLLAGFCIHGYCRFAEILSDPKFFILKKPFDALTTMSAERRMTYFKRRYKLLEQSLIVEEQLRRVNQLEKENAIVEAAVDQDSENKSSPSKNDEKEKKKNLIMTKAVHQLDDVISDIKNNDSSRIPATITKMAPVAERLHLSERQIMVKLTTKTNEAIAGKSVLPPPGPFQNEELGTKMYNLQSRFASISKAPVVEEAMES
uniref:DNA helicase n=1 Tax=Rhabditophanes sp. KR3021 TaxID=114890 RepID=A0AC35TG05_9BILA